uniref:Uncharacterized protein n=1 Tax=Spongospora subterranea TaxID=70186 RepID=A0A0H5QTK0_9EUKA|eukprot:CRZ05308.1 hypothetical protein [Spongospora subterranea]
MASTCPGANDDVQALINYYGRKQYFGHVQAICDHVLKGYESDNRDRARFWRCIAVIQQGESTPDIISDLHSVRNITYMSLAAIAALVSASKRADMDSVAELKQQLKAASKTKNAEMLVFAANFFWLIGKHQQARQCLERVLGDNPNNTGALTLMAWVNLTSEVPDLSQATLTYLNQAFTVLGDSPKPVDVLLGRAKWYELNCRTTNADESINMVLAAEAWFRPALIEKAQIQLMMRMPEDAAENVQKILKKDPANADAQLLFVTHLLSRVPDDPRILTAIQDLVSTIRRVEPTNANLYFKVSCLLSRLAFGNKSILDIAYSCIGQASSINPTNSEIRTEQAYQIFLKNDVASALQLYSEASQLDESKTGALNGMIRCKLFRGQLDDAAHELDFLEEIQGQKDTNRRSESAVELMALKGMLLKRRGSDKAMATELFTSAIKAHRERLGDLRLTPEYLISYNPDFILNAVEDILDLSGSCPREEGDPPRPALTFVGNVLVDVAEIIPGIVRPHLLLARTLYFDGLFSQAQTQIGACLRLDQRLIEPRLLRAQIEVQQQNWSEIADALDDIVSLNFEVRHTPLFHIVKVQLLEAQGQTNEALALIQSAMNLPGVRHKSSRAVVAESERVTLFLLSARLHARQMLSPEATKLLQDARSEFEASPEYDRILITDAELATSCRKDGTDTRTTFPILVCSNSNSPCVFT